MFQQILKRLREKIQQYILAKGRHANAGTVRKWEGKLAWNKRQIDDCNRRLANLKKYIDNGPPRYSKYDGRLLNPEDLIPNAQK